MAQLNILEYPDPRLRLQARSVTAFDNNPSQLVEDLFETLYATNAIGLCAPQTNDQREVLVMDLSGNATAPQEYINPEILASAVPSLVEESCLSVPDVVGNIVRAIQVRVRAQDQKGEFFERGFSDMEAVCLQHEIDYLSGKLFVDRLPFLRRLRICAAVKKRHASTIPADRSAA